MTLAVRALAAWWWLADLADSSGGSGGISGVDLESMADQSIVDAITYAVRNGAYYRDESKNPRKARSSRSALPYADDAASRLAELIAGSPASRYW